MSQCPEISLGMKRSDFFLDGKDDLENCVPTFLAKPRACYPNAREQQLHISEQEPQSSERYDDYTPYARPAPHLPNVPGAGRAWLLDIPLLHDYNCLGNCCGLLMSTPLPICSQPSMYVYDSHALFRGRASARERERERERAGVCSLLPPPVVASLVLLLLLLRLR